MKGKRMKSINVEGLKLLGKGFSATVYALDDKRALKVFLKTFPREDIEREYSETNKLYEMGIPCAKALEMVNCGESIGIIFERVYSKEMGDDLFEAFNSNNEIQITEWLNYYISFAKKLHGIVVKPSDLSDIRLVYIDKLCKLDKNYLSQDRIDRMIAFLKDIPDSNGYLHGDLNPYNVPKPGQDQRMVDVGFASRGQSYFDFAYLFSIDSFFEKIIPNFSVRKYNIAFKYIIYMQEYILDNYFDFSSDLEKSDMKAKLKSIGIIYGVCTDLGIPKLPDQMRGLIEDIVDESFS